MKVLPFFVNDLRRSISESIGLLNKEINEEVRLNDNGDFSNAYYLSLKEIVPVLDESVTLMTILSKYILIDQALIIERAHIMRNIVQSITDITKNLIEDNEISITNRSLLVMDLFKESSELKSLLFKITPTA